MRNVNNKENKILQDNKNIENIYNKKVKEMSEYASTVYGVIEYNIISPETQLAIANFIGNRNILDEHISRKCDRTAAYSLPSAYVNNLGIEFTPLT